MRTTLWNIVLAAGAGRRLASVTGGTPKQFWSPDGGSTLLEDTLRRSTHLAPQDRTVIVVDRSHAPFVDRLARLDRFDHLVYQPCDRGTAAGVLLGLMQVATAAPDATVLLSPSDHGVATPSIFVAGVRRAARQVRAGRSQVVLFGVAPATADGDYGWITPDATTAGERGLRPVAAFVEKPEPHAAARLLETGAVWNTMVLVARAGALLDLYRRHLPDLAHVFARSMRLDVRDRAAFLRDEYQALSAADFSRDLIGRAEGLSLHTWPASMGWSDLGTPDRLNRWRETQSSGRTVQRPRAGMLAPLPAC